MKITREEQIKIMIDRISSETSAGGGSTSYKALDLKKLSEFLVDLIESLPPKQ